MEIGLNVVIYARTSTGRWKQRTDTFSGSAPAPEKPSQTCPFIFRRIFPEINSKFKAKVPPVGPDPTEMAIKVKTSKYLDRFQGIFHGGTAAGRFLEVTGLGGGIFVLLGNCLNNLFQRTQVQCHVTQ